MTTLDPSRVQAHRRAEAAAGYPMLRACPNTFAIKRLQYLDRLSPEATSSLLDDWEAFEALPDAIAAEDALSRFPALEAYRADAGDGPSRKTIETLPVKVVAGSLKDPATGGTPEGWARLLGLPPEATRFTTPHAQSASDLVPVTPRTLRKAIAAAAKERFGAKAERIDAEVTRYIGLVGDCQIALEVHYVSNKGWRRFHQFNYLVWLKPAGADRIQIRGYEGLWGVLPEWDYITEEAAERAAGHLCDSAAFLAGLLDVAVRQSA